LSFDQRPGFAAVAASSVSGVTATTVAPQLSAWRRAWSTLDLRAAAQSTRISRLATSRPTTAASK
jgi:hypothetical protein